MSRLSLLKFLADPGEMAAGLRKLGGKGAVLQGLRRLTATTGRALLGPAQLRINPMGAVCNHACGMCWLQHLPPGVKASEFRKDLQTAMDLDEYRALFDGMPRGLTEVNVVGGGEPLVHPQATEIMRLIKARGYRGYLMSNGTLMREDVAAAMVDMGWDLTRLSVHAGDAATFRAIHGVDHFDRLADNLRTFDRRRRAASGRGKPVGMHVHNVIQRENIATIPRMFEFAERIGADHVVFEVVFALSPHVRLTRAECSRAADILEQCARQAHTSSNAFEIVAGLRREQADAPADRAPAPEYIGPMAEELLVEDVVLERTAPAAAVAGPSPAAPAPAPEDEPTVEPEPPYRPARRCSVGFDSAMVTAQGQVVPCCFSTEIMGNVREQTFREIWYGAAYSDFRQRLITGQFPEYCSRVRCKLAAFLHD